MGKFNFTDGAISKMMMAYAKKSIKEGMFPNGVDDGTAKAVWNGLLKALMNVQQYMLSKDADSIKEKDVNELIDYIQRTFTNILNENANK